MTYNKKKRKNSKIKKNATLTRGSPELIFLFFLFPAFSSLDSLRVAVSCLASGEEGGVLAMGYWRLAYVFFFDELKSPYVPRKPKTDVDDSSRAGRPEYLSGDDVG